MGHFVKAIEILQWQTNRMDCSSQLYQSRLECTHLQLLLEQHDLQPFVLLLKEIVMGFGGVGGNDVRLQAVHVPLNEMDEVIVCVCVYVCSFLLFDDDDDDCDCCS